jgi:pimeloyl-ACP methyl ester carboxylesterase
MYSATPILHVSDSAWVSLWSISASLIFQVLRKQLPSHKNQPRLLVIWGKYDLSFELSEPEAYRRDVPNAEVHVLDAGHFALDTAADEIAELIKGFSGAS